MSVKTYGDRVCLECGDGFIASKSNQIYCKSECTRKASNRKIIDRYHETRRLRSAKNRRCEKCGAKLSRYNQDPICNPCQQSKKETDKIDLLRKLGFEYISED